MSHEVTFQNAELAGLEIKTAKNSNQYAKGVLILRNEEGKFQASLPFKAWLTNFTVNSVA